MAPYYWRNANNDQNGTTAANYDVSPGGAAHTVPPGSSDVLHYDGGEDNVGLPTSMVAAVFNIVVSNAYAGLTDFTDFAVGSIWDAFIIDHVTLSMSGTPTILSGGLLSSFQDAGADGILDADNPVLAAGDCTIAWGFIGLAGLIIRGGLNADGNTITHTGSKTGPIICDVTGTLDLGAVADTGLAVEISNGTVTPGADLYCGDFTMTAGVFVGAGFEVYASGDVLFSAADSGSVFNITRTGVGTLDWNTTNRYIRKLTLEAGSITTLIGITRWAGFTGSGALVLNGQLFKCAAPEDNFWTYTGEITGSGTVELVVSFSRVNLAEIAAGEATLIIRLEDYTLTAGTLRTTGPVGMFAGADKIANIICNHLFGGVVTIGAASGTGSACLSVIGTASVAAVAAGHADNTQDALILGGGSHFECSGLFDAAGILVSGHETIPARIVCLAGGEIVNADPAQVVHVHGDASVDGGGNNGVNNLMTFNTQAPPGSRRLLGVGV